MYQTAITAAERSGGSDWHGHDRRRRALALGLTVGAELLFLLLLLALNPGLLPKPPVGKAPVLIDLGVESSPKPSPSPAKKVERTRTAATHVPVPVRPKPPATPVPPLPPSFIPLSSADMAAADISKLGSNAPGAESASTQSAKMQGPGEGPGGAKLYNAEWVVEPTRAQVANYMHKDVRPGDWGEIACKTIAHYHVEDCRQLGESPGSGLARVMREAAWQFLVRPERRDDKMLVGSWVRIHYQIVGKDDDEGSKPQ